MTVEINRKDIALLRIAHLPMKVLYPSFPDRVCEPGRFGLKTGESVYRYPPRQTAKAGSKINLATKVEALDSIDRAWPA